MAGLSKLAKYGVVAMVVTDAVGILLVQHRMHQPAPELPSIASEVAVADAARTLPRDTFSSDALTQDNLQVTDVVAAMDLKPLPSAARIDPLPAPMAIEPLAAETLQASPSVVRAMKAALRAPVIPTVRIAELHTPRRANRTFTTAFSSDITAATQSSRAAPTSDYAASSASVGTADMSAAPDFSSTTTAPSDAVNTAAPEQRQSEVPAPAFGGQSEPRQLHSTCLHLRQVRQLPVKFPPAKLEWGPAARRGAGAVL